MQACGSDSTIATGDSWEIERILTFFRHLKGRWTIGPGACHRLGCAKNAGFYWCNVSRPPRLDVPPVLRETDMLTQPSRTTPGPSRPRATSCTYTPITSWSAAAARGTARTPRATPSLAWRRLPTSTRRLLTRAWPSAGVTATTTPPSSRLSTSSPARTGRVPAAALRRIHERGMRRMSIGRNRTC